MEGTPQIIAPEAGIKHELPLVFKGLEPGNVMIHPNGNDMSKVIQQAQQSAPSATPAPAPIENAPNPPAAEPAPQAPSAPGPDEASLLDGLKPLEFEVTRPAQKQEPVIEGAPENKEPTQDPAPAAEPPQVESGETNLDSEPDINQLLSGEAQTKEDAASSPATPGAEAQPVLDVIGKHLSSNYGVPAPKTVEETTAFVDNLVGLYEKAYEERQAYAEKMQALESQVQKYTQDPRLKVLENDGIKELVQVATAAAAQGKKNIAQVIVDYLQPLTQDLSAMDNDSVFRMSLQATNLTPDQITEAFEQTPAWQRAQYANTYRSQMQSERAKAIQKINSLKADIQPAATQESPLQKAQATAKAKAEAKVMADTFRQVTVPQARPYLQSLNGHKLDDNGVRVLESLVSTYMDTDDSGTSALVANVLTDENGGLRPEVLAHLVQFDRRLNPKAAERLRKPFFDTGSARLEAKKEVVSRMSNSAPQSHTATPAQTRPEQTSGHSVAVLRQLNANLKPVQDTAHLV